MPNHSTASQSSSRKSNSSCHVNNNSAKQQLFQQQSSFFFLRSCAAQTDTNHRTEYDYAMCAQDRLHHVQIHHMSHRRTNAPTTQRATVSPLHSHPLNLFNSPKRLLRTIYQYLMPNIDPSRIHLSSGSLYASSLSRTQMHGNSLQECACESDQSLETLDGDGV
jgi:hypothetical protein